MNHPILNIEKDRIDNIFEGITMVLLMIQIVLILLFYKDLPPTIPRHFNASGIPDGAWNRMWIWTLPVISMIFIIFFKSILNVPHQFNYSVKITEDNAYLYYKHAQRALRFLLILCLFTFLYIEWQTVRIAMGEDEGLGIHFLIAFSISIITFIVYLRYSKPQEKKI